MIRKLIAALVGIAGIINLLQAILRMSSLSTISPLLLYLLAAILTYWLFVNVLIHKRADKEPIVVMLIVVPLALTLLSLGAAAFMERMTALRQMIEILGFMNATGVMITAAIFLWKQPSPKANS